MLAARLLAIFLSVDTSSRTIDLANGKGSEVEILPLYRAAKHKKLLR